MRPPLSVVIAARDEAARLPLLLADLAVAPELVREVLVVESGSTDATAAVARWAGARLLHSPPGRGAQLVHGIAAAEGPWLLLLHADVRLPPGWRQRLASVLDGSHKPCRGRLRAWYFELAIAGAGPLLRLVALGAGLRSRFGQRPYGDQGLLLPRALHDRVGGMRPLPLMEDLEFVERLARVARLESLGLALEVDGRRWRRLGALATTWRNAQLRRAWARGVAPAVLAERYYRAPQGAYQKAQRRPRGSSSHP
ncbi:MAG: TIGR04283 family arsenosugar biosynthesis glycosyltransferase [Synechococcus sp.]